MIGSKTEHATRSREQAAAPRLKHVALIVESAVAPRRMMLTGVARYIQEHEPWAIYLKPSYVEKSLGRWVRTWNGDGIISAKEIEAFVAMIKKLDANGDGQITQDECPAPAQGGQGGAGGQAAVGGAAGSFRGGAGGF